MSIENPDTIDFATFDNASGDLWLTISDHLPWEMGNEGDHLLLLQDKLNTYLRFIESGEVFDKVDGSKGRLILINIVGKYPLSPAAQMFIENAKAAIEKAGFGLRFDLMTAG